MKLKRIALIVCLIIYSFICFQMMNTRYNPLARYPYATKENRDVIIDTMSQDDINYIIQQKIKPEQFMDFITLEGFKAKNILYYDACKKMGNEDLEYILSFVNTYRKKIKLKSLPSLIENYGFKTLEAFYSGAYPYVENAKLVVNPLNVHTSLKETQTLYKYVPTGLVAVDHSILPSLSGENGEAIYVKEEMIESLKTMCKALENVNNSSAGGLILTKGYVSYDKQIKVYEEALIKYGVDHFLQYEDYPGQSERQLGLVISFTLAGMDEETIKTSDQVKWLSENAINYGFELCYPEGKEEETGKAYQPLTYRFVGVKTPEE